MTIPSGKRRRFAFGAAMLLASLFLSACAADAPQDTLDPAGDNARAAEDLWNLVFPIAVVIFVIVEVLLVYAVIRFRSKPGRVAAQFHGNTKLEVALTIIPALILAGISVPTVRTIFDLAEEPKGNVLHVTVIAHQFWWEYRYPDLGVVTANELHIPVDTDVRIRLEGQPSDLVDGTSEVIHAFWVPRLGGKQDIVPGRVNLITLSTDQPGEYLGQCTEFCGLAHAEMRLKVFAHEQDDFDAWVENLSAPVADSTSEGAELFAKGQFAGGPACSSCHAVDGTEALPNTGPNLAGFANRTTFASGIFENNTENLEAWLRDPNAVKEGAKMPNLQLTEAQIASLIDYLQSLD